MTNSSKNINEKEALSRASALCSRSEHCISQIEEKLLQWGVEGTAQTRIIDKLVQEDFINEQRFCHAFALDKLRYNHWGRIKIGQALRVLGVPSSYREEALRELPTEEYTDIIRHLIANKWPTIKASSDYERRGKLIRFLIGRGFELDIIQKNCNFAPDND